MPIRSGQSGFHFLPAGSVSANNVRFPGPAGLSAIRQVNQITNRLCLIITGFCQMKSGEIHSFAVNLSG
jgi:hypothetical protein